MVCVSVCVSKAVFGAPGAGLTGSEPDSQDTESPDVGAELHFRSWVRTSTALNYWAISSRFGIFEIRFTRSSGLLYSWGWLWNPDPMSTPGALRLLRYDILCGLRAVLGRVSVRSGVILCYVFRHLWQRTSYMWLILLGKLEITLGSSKLAQACSHFIYVYMYGWLAYTCLLHNTCVQFPWSPEEGGRCPGSAVLDGCETQISDLWKSSQDC